MKVDAIQNNGRKLRLLVAIASFGEKNLDLLKRIIRLYRSMDMDVDVVVLSNAPKDLEPGVRVIVGLPSKNPWSLPFGHKPVFAENVDRYDLFIYSEDDMEVTEQNIQAFLRVTPQLDPGEIAGYLRYELNRAGEKSLVDIHAASRWLPDSVRRRGDLTVAEFTNEHAAFYVLTRDQLKRCVASGGFLREPCEGRYDMLCTAATDPYTNCGFRRVVCLSGVDDFLIHHMSNRYVGQIGVSMAMFKQQVQTLMAIQKGLHPASTLCDVESKFIHGRWSKNLYEEPNEELLRLVPANTRTVLSVGCGWGAAEARLKERGVEVTALPLDSVVGVVAEQRGVKVVYGSLEKCLKDLAGSRFDCVIMTDLLHLMPNPDAVLEQCARVVAEGGTLLIAGPHLKSLRVQLKRVLGRSDFGKLGDFKQGGVSVFGPGTLVKQLKRTGFRNGGIQFFKAATVNYASSRLPRSEINGPLRSLKASEWILQASR